MKVGITCMTGDLLHAGHIAMLEECKKHCDYLILGLNANKFGKAAEKGPCIQSLFERYLQLDAVKYIDKIIPYESEQDLELMLKTLDIDIRFVGEDYKNKDFTGKQICVDRGIELFYNNRMHGLSTSELKARVRG